MLHEIFDDLRLYRLLVGMQIRAQAQYKVNMLTGILVPTGGTMRVAGLNPVQQRRELSARIGVVFGRRSQL